VLKYLYFPEVYRNITLPKFARLVNMIKNRISKSDVLFLTARHKIHYPATLLKLVYDLGLPGWKLKLVPHAHSKVPVINKMLMQYEVVVVIDDFSYNHETGNVCIYTEVLEDLAKTNARVITGHRLKRLQ
jgi:hypothetical protein